MNKKHKDVGWRRSWLWVFICCGLLIWSGCDKQASEPIVDDQVSMTDLVIDNDFDFSTTQNVDLNILVSDNRNEVLKNVKLELYTADPDSDGGQLIATGATGDDGRFTRTVSLPTGVEKVYLRSVHVGVMPGGYVPIENGGIRATFGYDNLGFIEEEEEKFSGLPSSNKATFNYKYLGSWDRRGRPLYLESVSDVVDSELLDRVNASLPERKPVPQYHPDFLASDAETNLEFTTRTQVWVSFLHEGAGWRNTFSFYTYDVNNPPQTKSDIDSITIVFPNVSARGSGGNMRVGDKVYLGEFDENTGVGFLLFGNGWKNRITEGNHALFSHSDLNPESTPELRQHNVLLHDNANDRMILAFEDLNREWRSCDNDFNDAIFLITADAYSSIKSENIRPMDITTDTDGDGISDYYDDYPNDPNKAFDNYYPSENSYGTLGYEDQWPIQGDYDFNDLVIDYRYNEVTNVKNEVVEVSGKFVIKAVGAAYENGFG
ncbi:MAG: LruC domain-containing protein, partial [Calditrichota bacterium]